MIQKILEIYLLTRKGIVEPTILIFGSRFLAIPSRVINYVRSKAKLPSNLIPWLADINSIPWIVLPTLISGIGTFKVSSKCLFSYVDRLSLTSLSSSIVERLLISAVQDSASPLRTDQVSLKKLDWSFSFNFVTIPASIKAILTSKS